MTVPPWKQLLLDGCYAIPNAMSEQLQVPDLAALNSSANPSLETSDGRA
jgi:hypothetical protein